MKPRITLCSVCHSQMPVGQSYCKNCGSTLCPHCRELLPQRSRFCPKCGFLCVVEQQSPIPPAQRAGTVRQQQISIPRPSMAFHQTPASVPTPQPSVVSPGAQYQRNCPKCGASIDHELGRCSGCGLLFGVKHRVIQQTAAMPATQIQHAPITRPQSPLGQQSHVAYNTMAQYNSPSYTPSPNLGQHSNYMPAAVMPQPGMLMPIPRIAPAHVGATFPGTSAPPRPYEYHAGQPAFVEQHAPAPRKGGLSGFVTTMIIIVICLLVGSGVYYFINRNETAPAVSSVNNVNSPTNNPLLNVQDISESITETGATIKWATDKPATTRVQIRDASGAAVETKTDSTLINEHSITISGLKPNTKYYYTVISTDSDGNETTSEGELTTLGTKTVTSDKTPPTISGVAFANVTESSAIITWVTNEPATSQVKYTKDDNNSLTTPVDTDLAERHSVMLTKLESGATYSFTAISKDAAGNEATSPTGQTFTTLSPIKVGSEVGNRAPEFDLKDLNGRTMKLSDFTGQIVMLNFWAVWCEPCKGEFPLIQAVSENWSSRQLVVLAIAVNTQEQFETVKDYIQQNPHTFSVLFDAKGEVQNLYNVKSLPTTFFIDKKGIIRKIQDVSFQDQSTIENILSTLQ